MSRKARRGIILVFLVSLLAGGVLHGQSDLCNTVDMKPVLSLQQVRQAEFVHFLVVLSGFQPPDPQGLTVEQMYEAEVQILIKAGYPPAFAEIEPDRLVTRRYFASVIFQIAVETDDSFRLKYGSLTDETQQLEALVNEEWLFAEEGRIYREELLSILCLHQPELKKYGEIVPEEYPPLMPIFIKEANIEPELEVELSPI